MRECRVDATADLTLRLARTKAALTPTITFVCPSCGNKRAATPKGGDVFSLDCPCLKEAKDMNAKAWEEYRTLNFPIIMDDSIPPIVALMGHPGGPKVVMDLLGEGEEA